ncbi:hypothetical protein [Streptomyces chartreusis]|uniref:hypothetical protein n=1 Tax=Streptomyces chartreusis TaxID=1969 RepID=UPI003815D1BB
MTIAQLALGCETNGHGRPDVLDPLCNLGTELIDEGVDSCNRDLLGQGLTAQEIHSITTVPITETYL